MSVIIEGLNQWSFGPGAWLAVGLGIALAYIVFGIAGFGTALVAGPVLILFMPLSKIVPLLVLLDFVAAFGNLLPSRKDVARPELLRLLPCMALGCTLGVIFLLNLKSDLLLLLMGLFISAYAIYSLWVKLRPTQLAAGWAVPMGVVGGMFGALFGSGGFLYAIYLNSRLPKDPARATQSALISCSTVVRLSLFALAGVYAELPLLLLAGCLLPSMALGLWVGRRLTMRLSREAFVRLVTWLVLASGVALIGRYLST
ncbi:sulfite exporter TauE/SafE family protein [Pseudomonas sp. TKO26]|uniref:sulfite exporter TauE/SafE family protein n=1 Tax=unclassified Pseudomonas TaxID=196821 RepID=UPI000D90D5AA|nr:MULTISPECIES: sulfite exporter TauE/SafE family protein [unclassified Pseudomonas]PYY92230.1 sulfite exporter TauE/SafE family protein [Pseudomonas sp. TKO30]PYY94593.1 sulfite exporter TauE/SafE family protein [Pseudomonas sp. TKO29]PYY96466.1 sulfite exporter TauE/SafE family protein [Pseudomonas sp. TKO26]PYZ02058.1 sulfite exporter TauE/SafE family protein [Pseudomonas sp. TKO14]